VNAVDIAEEDAAAADVVMAETAAMAVAKEGTEVRSRGLRRLL
jgi:hypothetical protein